MTVIGDPEHAPTRGTKNGGDRLSVENLLHALLEHLRAKNPTEAERLARWWAEVDQWNRSLAPALIAAQPLPPLAVWAHPERGGAP